LQPEKGTDLSLADADPQVGQKEGMRMFVIAIHIVGVLPFDQGVVFPWIS